MEIKKIMIHAGGAVKIEEYTEQKEKDYRNKGYLLDRAYDGWSGEEILFVNKDFNHYTKIQARRLLEKYKQLRIELWIKIIFGTIFFLSIINIYTLVKSQENLGKIVKITKQINQKSERSKNLDKFNFGTGGNKKK